MLTSLKFYFFHGMAPLSLVFDILQTHMVNAVRPCWISTLEPFNGMWHLSENGKPRGQFDVIVIAHNGTLHLFLLDFLLARNITSCVQNPLKFHHGLI